jgi:hypothetical protein
MERMVTNDRNTEFSQRLNAVLDHIDFAKKGEARQKKLGELFNVGEKGARKWIENEGMPRQSRHQDIIEKLNEMGAEITGEWLFYGDTAKAPIWYKHLMGIKEKAEYKVAKNETQPDESQSFQNFDFSDLLLDASEGTQEIIKNLQIGLRENRLSEEDIELLNTITRRLMSGKTIPVATNPQHAKLLREAEKNQPDQ